MPIEKQELTLELFHSNVAEFIKVGYSKDQATAIVTSMLRQGHGSAAVDALLSGAAKPPEIPKSTITDKLAAALKREGKSE